MSALISVIVPALNAQATIDRCLSALDRQTLPRDRYEVIVVDDGSTDDTRAMVEAHGRLGSAGWSGSAANIRLLTVSHAGPAAARNLGVEQARGEIVLFTDADCEPAPDWIERMLDPFDDAQVVGVKGTYGRLGSVLTHQRGLVARFVQMEYERKYERMARHMVRQGRIDFVDTYAAGYRRDVFCANGGFDTSFPEASVEDQELSFRLARSGFKMVFAPRAVVYHWGHASTVWAYARKKFKVGYWKVAVHRRHPDKLWRDSHTPQALKLQILLVGLAGPCLLSGLAWPSLLWLSAASGGLFMLTTFPFAARGWGKDHLAAIVSPGMLLVRALALGTGFAVGSLGHIGRRTGR